MTKIKICGLRGAADIEAVNRALPDYIGWVFAPGRRQVDAATAARLKERLDGRIGTVGVFVNEAVGQVEAIYRMGILDMIQLHGDEDGAYIRRLQISCGCPVIKAVGIGGRLPDLPAGADYLLFDRLSARRGGTGQAFDWHILKGYRDRPYFLAGGLSSVNVADAIGLLHPFCVDVSSGAETDGVKDAEKIEQIVRTVRRTV
jgi:phosphoribosylanthranilate isomerase